MILGMQARVRACLQNCSSNLTGCDCMSGVCTIIILERLLFSHGPNNLRQYGCLPYTTRSFLYSCAVCILGKPAEAAEVHSYAPPPESASLVRRCPRFASEHGLASCTMGEAQWHGSRRIEGRGSSLSQATEQPRHGQNTTFEFFFENSGVGSFFFFAMFALPEPCTGSCCAERNF